MRERPRGAGPCGFRESRSMSEQRSAGPPGLDHPICTICGSRTNFVTAFGRDEPHIGRFLLFRCQEENHAVIMPLDDLLGCVVSPKRGKQVAS